MENEHIKWSEELLWELKDVLDWSALWKIKPKIAVDDIFLNKFNSYLDINSLHICDLQISLDSALSLLKRITWNDRLFCKLQLIHPDLLGWFPLAENMDWKVLSRSIRWDAHYIKKYSDYIDWDELSSNSNIEFSVELIKECKDQLNFSNLSINPSVVSVIKIYPKSNKWNWDKVILNRGFNYKNDFFFLYKNYIKYSGIIEKWIFQNRDNQWFSNKVAIKWIKYKFVNIVCHRAEEDSYLRRKYLHLLSVGSLRTLDKVRLSLSEIEMLSDKLDFNSKLINFNSEIFNDKIIVRYFDRFDFNKRTANCLNFSFNFINENSKIINWCYLSFNENIKWSREFIESNIDKLDLFKLSINKKVYDDLRLTLADLN
ncbi:MULTISPECIES: hypothetical protein [Bacteroidota]|uniref:hypothetical protein n=1 Tax=Bacteroidota TaxID=976 RepID=UPI00289C073A|nr:MULTISPECIES: hypothetical protein [Bacteroidota]